MWLNMWGWVGSTNAQPGSELVAIHMFETAKARANWSINLNLIYINPVSTPGKIQLIRLLYMGWWF